VFLGLLRFLGPLPLAARSKAWECGRSLAVNADSNPAGSMDISLLRVSCVVEVAVPATGRSIAHRSPTDCVVSNRA